jgi:uncharacterized protein (TIGR02145 family)
LASYTNEGFGAIALNDSLLTEYLVGVAAASEEGDSTLGAWVMQLSEVVEQQQAQIDSLSTVNLGLAFGATEHAKFHELEWTQQENAGNALQTILSFENDVLFRLYGGNSQIKFVIIPNSANLDLVANANLAEANFSESFWVGENPTITLALNSDEMLVIFANSGALEAETTTGEMNVFWTPLVQNSNEAGDPTENNEDNLGPCQGEFTVNYHGYDYELVEIGDQCWFAENLRTTSYRNGEVIEEGNSVITGFSGSSWANLNQLTHVVQGDEGNYYSLGVVQSDLAICPAGWSVPSRNDWIELAAEVDLSLGGHFLKDSVAWNGSDSFGFGARPTGIASRQLITYDNDWFHSWSQCRDEWLWEQEWYNELQQHIGETEALWDSEFCHEGTITPLCQGAMDALYNELDSLSSNGLALFESEILPFYDAGDISYWVHVNLNAPFCPSQIESVEDYYGEILNSYTQQSGHRAYWWMSAAEFSGHFGDWGGVKGFIFLNDGTSILDFVQYGIGSDLGINENISIRCVKD